MSNLTEQLNTALADRYRIERHIGEGGMATVYVANDLKHDRKVALKVLRPELAAVIGGERFLNEIKVTANLQHPHILPLHDSGEAESFLYYVMPFIEGDTLRDKLDREKQFDIDEAIELTRSVASALDYAHRQGVIHRDVKPENVLIHDGQALVADFGIALAVSQASGARLTETGLSIGTPHYMSPEQAMGDRELDGRSDVYSLGAMLYEMLAGHPPYTGNTAQAIVAKVITEKAPPVTETRDTVPPNVAAAVAKALQKMPADRFASASAFAEALTNPGFGVSATQMGTIPEKELKRSGIPAAVLAAGVVVALSAGALVGRMTAPDEPVRLARFGVAAPESTQVVGRCCGRSIAMAPAGDRIVFPSGGADGRLYRRELGRLDAEPINGTEGASIPFFSPDGRWLGFYLDGRLRKVPMAGGPPIPITEVPRASGGSWGDNDMIVFGGPDAALYAVPAAGGQPTQLTEPGPGTGHVHPFMLPGGRRALFSITAGGPNQARIGIVDLESGIVDTIGYGTRAEYANGYMVFTGADRTLLAQPFDAGSGETTGDAVALLDGVQFRGSSGMAEFALSSEGGLVYEPGFGGGAETLEIVGSSGRETVPLTESGDLEDPAFSPDGRRIALRLTDVGASNDIWIFDHDQGTLTRLTVEGGVNRNATWTPDGRRVTFSSSRRGERAIFWKPFDGSGPAELVFAATYPTDPLAWLPNGRQLLVRAVRDSTGPDIGLLTVGDSALSWLVATEFAEAQAQPSPDGRWFAYASDRSGQPEVYVQAIGGEGGRYQVSTDGGWSPRWSPGGAILYYVSSGTLIAASVTTEPEFRVTARADRFGGITDLNFQNVNYDVHPDGEQFLVINQSGSPGGSTMVWILGWPEIVREMVGR